MKTGSVFCQQHILNWVVELGCLWNPGVFLRLKFGKRFNQTSCVWFPEDIRIHQLLGFFQSVGLNRFMWIILLDWFPGPRWRLITIRWRVDRLISWLVLGVCQRIGLRNDNRYCLCGGFDYFLFFTPTRGDDPIWRTYLSKWVGPTTNLKMKTDIVPCRERFVHIVTWAGEVGAFFIDWKAVPGKVPPKKFNCLPMKSYLPQ